MAGSFGVDLFFVLSGFLITNILLQEYRNTGRIRILNFYKRRLLRLYPPILVAVLIFLIPFMFIDFRMAISNTFFLVTYTGDVVMLFRYLIPYLEYPLMFSHCWSLSIEEQFYLFFPVTMLFVLNFANRKAKSNAITTFILFNVLFVATVYISTILLHAHFYKFFLWRFFEILFGGFVSVILCGHANMLFKETKGLSAFTTYITAFYKSRLILIASIVLYFYFIATGGVLQSVNLNYYIFTVVSTVLIVNAAFDYSKWYSNILSNKVANYLGKISYGLYLYHWPIYFISAHHLGLERPTGFAGSVTLDICRIAATLVLSILSFEYIEKPILKFKDRLHEKKPDQAPEKTYLKLDIIEKQDVG